MRRNQFARPVFTVTAESAARSGVAASRALPARPAHCRRTTLRLIPMLSVALLTAAGASVALAQGSAPAAQTPVAGQSTDSTETLADKPGDSIQGGYDRGQFDLDHDGTLSLAEAKSAAAYRFDKLDGNHDGTLSRKELGTRVGATEFRQANADSDMTLDKAEYLKLVEERFKAVDKDGEGTLDKAEMAGPGGRMLMSLLK